VTDPLDNPIWHSLTGAHAPLARDITRASRPEPAAGTVQRGERPMPQVPAGNRSAIALYERLGFVVRRSVQFEFVQTL
jgi:hypothetical protein